MYFTIIKQCWIIELETRKNRTERSVLAYTKEAYYEESAG